MNGAIVHLVGLRGHPDPRRFRRLLTFFNAVDRLYCTKFRLIHERMNECRLEKGLGQETWVRFVARVFFSLTFKVDGNKIAWRNQL